MTDKKIYAFILLPMLVLTIILGLLVLNSSAKAAEGVGTATQTGLIAWNPLNNALVTTSGADGLALVSSVPNAPDACTPDTTSMMSYWPLDETSGTAFTDVVDGNHGACTNCPTPGTGIVSGAQTFNAAETDGILITEDVANPLTWASAESFSFEVWVSFSETCEANKVFFGRYRTGVSSEAQWWIGCAPGGFPAFALKAANAPMPAILIDDVAINDGQWHHVVAVRDAGANLNRLYVDGAEAINVTQSYTTDFTSTGPISIGYFSTSYYFSGSIDELAVYDKALSSTEVSNHYNDGTGQSYCNDAPNAVADDFITDEDTNLDFTGDELLANDDDPDGNPITLTAVDTASTEGGTITDLGGGNYQYVPPEDFNGMDTFEYDISDGNGGSATGTVNVAVGEVNDPPEADDQPAVTTDEDVAVDITLTGTDPDGDALTFSVVDEPTNGSLTGTAPDLTYTPDENYNGGDSFTFTANDGEFDSNTATVTITINPAQDPPDAVDDAFDVDEDTNLDFTEAELLANDTDPDGDTLTISTVDASSVEGGTLTDLGSGNYQYAPPADFNGTDTFTYTVLDGIGGEDTATVTVTVNPANDAPVVDDQEVSTGFEVAVDITLTGTDIDGDELTFAVVDAPANGTLSGIAPDLSYTPDDGFSGSDSFTFKANDGTVDSELATVDITVTPPGTPDAVDDDLETDEDTAVEFPDTFLLSNDTDPYDADLTIADIDTTSAEGGTIEDIGGGYYRYTPFADFFGTDTFTYTVTNGTETDTATVSVTVNPVEDEVGKFLFLPMLNRAPGNE